MFEQTEDEEWGGYMGETSSREVATSAFGMSGLAYVPDLSPVGSGSAGTYYPRDTKSDAAALNYLGFFPQTLFEAHVGTSGSQQADMAAHTGAWSPAFQQAVKDFQEVAGIGVDGWIGPGTRTKLAQAVTAKNAKAGLDVGPLPNVLPSIPGVLPSVPNGPQKASSSSSNTGTYLAIGAGVLALGLGAWFLSND